MNPIVIETKASKKDIVILWKLNYARGGCRRECEISLPRLSKWANIFWLTEGRKGLKLARPKSTV